ncbi:MAG: LacI family DNA-binding transcriptional regulator [Cyclobacteriaceae bacterium]
MKEPTIYHIANQLDISASTVSRAIADNPRISTKTKERVIAKAKELGYRQNRIASSLRSGRGTTIGVVVPQIQRYFFSSVIHGIEVVLNGNGFNLIICQSNEDACQEEQAIKTLMDNRVDGILISCSKQTTNHDHIRQVTDLGVPVVQFDRVMDEMLTSSVINDNYSGAYKLVTHLIEQGYSRIAHLAGPQNLSLYRLRLEGYKKALDEAGIECSQELIRDAITIEAGTSVAADLMKQTNPPDAFFAASDLSALGALNYLKAECYEIPGEVGVAGFGNEPLTEMITPSLTTMEQFGVDMGKKSAMLLLDSINGVDQIITTSTLINPRLVVRESTKRT